MRPSWMPMQSAQTGSAILACSFWRTRSSPSAAMAFRKIATSSSRRAEIRSPFSTAPIGIFVADPETGKLQKVFDPDPSIVAVSTPIWADDESAAIFTTARVDQPAKPAAKGANAKGEAVPSAAQSTSLSTPADWNDLPEGRIFFAQHIIYTCWLVERPANGPLKKPISLFEARCNHSGYVAANLAVRLHSSQKAILFVDRESTVSHAVWLFNLEKKSKTRIFPPPGQVRRPTSSPSSCRMAVTLLASRRNRTRATRRPFARAKSKPPAWQESGSARATARIGGTSQNRSRPGKTILRSGSPI